ncbi:MAG TPA: alanine racemase [Tepidisphaeraceae bacterium]|nr:alanine racemase [Tepidisphaeraceae bacterium]
MAASSSVTVRIDLARIRGSAQEIRRRTGVAVLAVVKADAYGLGAAQVAEALADLADGWCVFSLAEAVQARLWQRTGKPTIVLGPPMSLNPGDYLPQHTRPAVSTLEQARALAAADPLLCVDTGMQRFACPRERIESVLDAGACREAFTHATRMEHVRRLLELVGNRQLRLHAAASDLLDLLEARLDAVRPGLVLYREAVRVSVPLLEARDTTGPAGYSGFVWPRIGVILCGYSQGLRKGPCLINGQRRYIPEVGMQSAYVQLQPGDRAGDEVVLLGDTLRPEDVAAEWKCSPHEVLITLASAGRPTYAS